MPITLAEGEAVRMPKHNHKHKPGMVMVISIGSKPKKKGETGVVKKGSKCYYCKKVMNYDSEFPYPMCSGCAQKEDPESLWDGTGSRW